MPRDIGDKVLEETIRGAIYLTSHEVNPDALHAYHRLKSKDSNFKVQRQKVKTRNSNKQKRSPVKIFGTLSMNVFW